MKFRNKVKDKFKYDSYKVKKLADKFNIKVTHQMGDKHFIEGIECAVRFMNNGKAWLCPTTDDKDEPMVARHIAYATIDEYGKVEML